MLIGKGVVLGGVVGSEPKLRPHQFPAPSLCLGPRNVLAQFGDRQGGYRFLWSPWEATRVDAQLMVDGRHRYQAGGKLVLWLG